MRVFKFIHAKKADYSINSLCHSFSVSPSGYYNWLCRPKSHQSCENDKISFHMRVIFRQTHGSYGARRMMEALSDHNIHIGKYRTRRLMNDNQLIVKRSKKQKRTTNSNHHLPIYPNLLNQDFTAYGKNQKWTTDISYIRTGEGWGYLAVIMDLYSRQVVGWEFDKRMTKELVINALNKAIILRNPHAGLILHSDRGAQYCSHEYQRILKQNNIQCSMSGKGNCYDNAPMESLFKTLKAECVWRTRYQTRTQAKNSIGHYINSFYNTVRKHSFLNYKSHMQFERINMIKTNEMAA